MIPALAAGEPSFTVRVIRHGRQRGVCHGSSNYSALQLQCGDAAPTFAAGARCGQGAPACRSAAIFEGPPRGRAAEIAGVTPQIVRDWVMQYNEEESDGLVNRKAPGPVSRLIDAQRRALAKRMEAGPDRPSTAW